MASPTARRAVAKRLSTSLWPTSGKRRRRLQGQLSLKKPKGGKRYRPPSLIAQKSSARRRRPMLGSASRRRRNKNSSSASRRRDDSPPHVQKSSARRRRPRLGNRNSNGAKREPLRNRTLMVKCLRATVHRPL